MPETGDIRVSLCGGDRRPWSGGPVNLRLIDPFSQTEKVLVDHRTGAGVNSVLLERAPADRGQNYSLLASADGCRDAGLYPVKPLAGREIQAALMLVPSRPAPDLASFSFAALEAVSAKFHQALTAAGITEAAFAALPPERIAGALNVEAKLRGTSLAGARAVDFVVRAGGPEHQGTDSVEQDRIFAWVDKTMPAKVREDIRQSKQKSFRELDEAENEVFHRGYPVSFKQRVPFGSLQLSFARRAGDNDLLAADIDIDLFTDIGHFGEVLRNHILSQKTDPFTVYRMLFDQGIVPLYTLAAG